MCAEHRSVLYAYCITVHAHWCAEDVSVKCEG